MEHSSYYYRLEFSDPGAYSAVDLGRMFRSKSDSTPNEFLADLPYLDDNMREGARRDVFWEWLKALLPGREVLREYRLADGSLADLVVLVDGVVRVAVEFQLDVRVNQDRDQGLRYAVNIFRVNPNINSLVIILTDGFQFYPLIATRTGFSPPLFQFDAKTRVLCERFIRSFRNLTNLFLGTCQAAWTKKV